MKKNRLYFGMLILMLVAVIIWAFYNMLNVGKQETSYRVSVVVENSNSDRWTSLRQGLEQAARDYNISLSFVSTGSFSTAMEEMDVVKKQVTNGANGIILQMNTDRAGQDLEDLSGQTAVLLLETDVLSATSRWRCARSLSISSAEAQRWWMSVDRDFRLPCSQRERC